MKTLKILLSGFFFFSLTGQAVSRKLVCVHTVMDLAPFCTVTLKELEDGSVENPVQIEHQGKPMSSLIQEVDLKPGELYHLFLDADKPGKEIEMIVKSTANEKGEYPAVLINHEAPFAKEMKGACTEE
ncbi:MAG: hypothetical protein EBQ92_03510 [Proteobacteria bacterium]|jgi:hypothetical protein|nr:hypothetical protein [Pseudomonadota bacterium]